MNKELKRVSIVVLLMFVALMCSGTFITVIQADELRANDRNVRTLYESYSAERGPLLVDGTPIAESVPVDDNFKFLRTYTNPELYAAVTGYFTLNQGNAGVEGSLNEYLSGTADSQFLDQINSILTGKNPKGAAVELTIDPVAQQAAWDALGDRTGAVIALNPSTGAILAMVSKPSYDPNLLASHDTSAVIEAYNQLLEAPGKPLFNRTISGDLYHPGSVFKVLVAAAALDSGQFTPETTLPNPAELQLPLSSTFIQNANRSACGPGAEVTLADALRVSCNIPFAEIGATLGEDIIADYAEAFGYGKRIEVPMAASASYYPKDMDAAQLMLSSFGQFDVRVTPLQVAMTTAGVANGGVVMQPTLIESIIAPDLTVIEPFQEEVYSEPISEQTAATLSALMVNNVSNGAASSARISGVNVGGKTGTAQNVQGSANSLWFTGFAPAEDPQIAIAVVVEGQQGFGGGVAAPVAKRVIEAVLNK